MLEAKHLTKHYGKRVVIDDLTFTAERGEVTALIGVNGVGKTTIMNTIMGLLPIEKGEVLIDGKKRGKDWYEKIAYVTDQAIVNKKETIREAMCFMQTFYPNWNGKKALELLQFFHFTGNETIGALSKGNVAKVNLLLGLSLDVSYILMDEPFSGIDIFSREQIAKVFTTDLVEGVGVLITTHEIDDIEYLVDKAILLDEGHIVKTFYPEEARAEGKSIVDVMREVYRP